MEELCPDAVLFNYTNPMATHCLGIQRVSDIQSIGLCHGVMHTRLRIILMTKLAQMSEEESAAVMSDWTPQEQGKEGYWDLYWEMQAIVKKRFDAEGISIPFPQRDVHVYNENPATS